MAAPSRQSSMSVEAYLALDRSTTEMHYEYIDGYAYALAGRSLDHSTICANLIGELRDRLRGGPCRTYTSDARVRLSETRYVYPDVSVSCDPRDRGGKDILSFPCLIIEVLSPGTREYDRGSKFEYYRDCPTIEEYVLVDTKRQAIDLYRRAAEDL